MGSSRNRRGLLTEDEGQRPKGSGRASLPEVRDDPPSGAVHRSILAGFVSNIGHRTETGDYRGITGTTFAIFPGSVLRRQDAPWIMAAEIVETSSAGPGPWPGFGRLGRTRRPASGAQESLRTSFRSGDRLRRGVRASGLRRSRRGRETDRSLRADRRGGGPGGLHPAGLVGERLPGDAAFLARNRELSRETHRLGDRGREQACSPRTRSSSPSTIPDSRGDSQRGRAGGVASEGRTPRPSHSRDAGSDLMAVGHDRPNADAYPDRSRSAAWTWRFAIDTSRAPRTTASPRRFRWSCWADWRRPVRVAGAGAPGRQDRSADPQSSPADADAVHADPGDRDRGRRTSAVRGVVVARSPRGLSRSDRRRRGSRERLSARHARSASLHAFRTGRCRRAAAVEDAEFRDAGLDAPGRGPGRVRDVDGLAGVR